MVHSKIRAGYQLYIYLMKIIMSFKAVGFKRGSFTDLLNANETF